MEYKTKRDLIIDEIMEYFNSNDEDFVSVLEEMDGWNGYLGDDRLYSMDDFDDLFCGASPYDIACRVGFGDFNAHHDYFRFNGYGNIVSEPYKDYSDHIDKYTIEDIAKFENDLQSIEESEELKVLFQKLKDCEEVRL